MTILKILLTHLNITLIIEPQSFNPSEIEDLEEQNFIKKESIKEKKT